MSGGGGKGGGGSNFSSKDAANLVTLQGQQNRISQFGPSGNLVYGTVDPSGQFKQGTNNIAAQTQETPYQQQMRLGQQGTASTLFNQLSPQAGNLQQLNFSGLPQGASSIDWSKVQGVPGADQFGDAANRASSAVYERGMQMMRPDMAMEQRRTDQRLADQGLPIGGEAYSGEQDRLARSQDLARNNLALGAVGAGNDEAARLYQQALQGRQAQIGDQTLGIDIANQARQMGIGEQTGLRSSQLSELQGLLGGGYNPVPAPSFFGPGQVNATAGAQMQQNSNLANQNQMNQLWGGLAGLGGTLGGAYLLCWVAREVYGLADPRWIRFREWLLTKAPKWLLRLYAKKGEKFADFIAPRPRLKTVVRFLMDRVI